MHTKLFLSLLKKKVLPKLIKTIWIREEIYEITIHRRNIANFFLKRLIWYLKGANDGDINPHPNFISRNHLCPSLPLLEIYTTRQLAIKDSLLRIGKLRFRDRTD